jgi:hypothetical protein
MLKCIGREGARTIHSDWSENRCREATGHFRYGTFPCWTPRKMGVAPGRWRSFPAAAFISACRRRFTRKVPKLDFHRGGGRPRVRVPARGAAIHRHLFRRLHMDSSLARKPFSCKHIRGFSKCIRIVDAVIVSTLNASLAPIALAAAGRVSTCSSRSRAPSARPSFASLPGPRPRRRCVRIGYNHRFHPGPREGARRSSTRAPSVPSCSCGAATATAGERATTASGAPTPSFRAGAN